ncbi:amino acid ABC transporter substrate-binding protein [Paraburkholderia bengalensis]
MTVAAIDRLVHHSTIFVAPPATNRTTGADNHSATINNKERQP